jgi:hypothetical protein
MVQVAESATVIGREHDDHSPLSSHSACLIHLLQTDGVHEGRAIEPQNIFSFRRNRFATAESAA